MNLCIILRENSVYISVLPLTWIFISKGNVMDNPIKDPYITGFPRKCLRLPVNLTVNYFLLVTSSSCYASLLPSLMVPLSRPVCIKMSGCCCSSAFSLSEKLWKSRVGIYLASQKAHAKIALPPCRHLEKWRCGCVYAHVELCTDVAS